MVIEFINRSLSSALQHFKYNHLTSPTHEHDNNPIHQQTRVVDPHPMCKPLTNKPSNKPKGERALTAWAYQFHSPTSSRHGEPSHPPLDKGYTPHVHRATMPFFHKKSATY